MEASGVASGPTEIARGHPVPRICCPRREPPGRDLELHAPHRHGVTRTARGPLGPPMGRMGWRQKRPGPYVTQHRRESHGRFPVSQWTAVGTENTYRRRIRADPCGTGSSNHDVLIWLRKAIFAPSAAHLRSGEPRSRTSRCGFGDRRVTDTPVPRGAAILGPEHGSPP